MTSTVLVIEFDEKLFHQQLNDNLAKLEQKNCSIVDIKFSSFSGTSIDDDNSYDYIGYSALIIYIDSVKH